MTEQGGTGAVVSAFSWRLLRTTAALMCVAVVLTACVRPRDDDGPATKSYLQGDVSIGVIRDLPGWSAEAGGGWTGFEVDLARWLGVKFDFTPRYVALSDRDRVTALQNRDVKMVIANFAITDSRRQEVDFAGPYLVDSQGILSKASFKESFIENLADLNGRTACSVTASTAEARLSRYPAIRMLTQPSLEQCVDLVRSGRADAVVGSRVVLESVANRPTGVKLEVSPEVEIGNEYYGIGLPDGSPLLCADLTAALSDYLRSDWQTSFQRNLPAVDYTTRRPDPASMFPCERNDRRSDRL